MAGIPDATKLNQLKAGIQSEISRITAEPSFSVGEEVMYVDQQCTLRCSVVGQYYNGNTAMYRLKPLAGQGQEDAPVFESLLHCLSRAAGAPATPSTASDVGVCGGASAKGVAASLDGASVASRMGTIQKTVNGDMDWEGEHEFIGTQTQCDLSQAFAAAEQVVAERKRGRAQSLDTDQVSGPIVGSGGVGESGVTRSSRVVAPNQRVFELRDWAAMKRCMAVITKDITAVEGSLQQHFNVVMSAVQQLDSVKQTVTECHELLKKSTACGSLSDNSSV